MNRAEFLAEKLIRFSNITPSSPRELQAGERAAQLLPGLVRLSKEAVRCATGQAVVLTYPLVKINASCEEEILTVRVTSKLQNVDTVYCFTENEEGVNFSAVTNAYLNLEQQRLFLPEEIGSRRVVQLLAMFHAAGIERGHASFLQDIQLLA